MSGILGTSLHLILFQIRFPRMQTLRLVESVLGSALVLISAGEGKGAGLTRQRIGVGCSHNNGHG